MAPAGSEGGASWGGGLDAELLVPALLHELKQPLTGADAAIALLERVLGAAVTAREEWRLLRQQIARLAEVMGGYDELFHAPDAREGAFEVGAAVSRAVQLLSHRIRPIERRFAIALGGGPVHGFGSPAALVHAATNLLGNAVDAAEAAGPEARVAVRVLPAGRGSEVRISDEGPGIPEAVRVHLFEARFSTKPPERGSGLGLHLSRRLMSRFGGEVYLVGPEDPSRLPWAVTEFCIAVPPPPAGRTS
jgi:C4-dicarboxylate-specific signal transduction histidine kinase